MIDKPLVKILTGIRRSGKSSVLLLLKDVLAEKQISEDQIVHINFESFAHSDLLSAKALYEFISLKAGNEKKLYLLFDEIQEVDQWEKAINSISVDFDTDIYLTGSNSQMLSSELATFLTGRYIEIPVYTLSFSEYLQFRSFYLPDKQQSVKESFSSYLRLGGFPIIHTAGYSDDTAHKVVYDIYSSVILRDTVQRHKIRDIELLERIIRFVFNNIGNSFSGKHVADHFKSQQRKLDINTVYNYLHALESAFIVYRTPRYDMKGKELLKTQEKYFLSDVGLLYATQGYADSLISGILENIVFLELKRRGYKVYVGKHGKMEIDFIAEKPGDKVYVQVAYKLNSENTVDREFSSLLTVKDQYPKYVVTMDDFWKENKEGVRHVYISDFLLAPSF
ncbi:MAG: ATP-binding protein [Bacteroidales bacterium]